MSVLYRITELQEPETYNYITRGEKFRDVKNVFSAPQNAKKEN